MFAGNFVVLTAGALRVVVEDTCEIAADCIGFLSLFAHPKNGPGTVLYVADTTPGGRFDLMFCSTKCLRTFLNSAVDALEAAAPHGTAKPPTVGLVVPESKK